MRQGMHVVGSFETSACRGQGWVGQKVEKVS
jgi:hypothetical protein